MTDSLFTRIGNAFTTGGATETEQQQLRGALAATPAPIAAEDLPAPAQKLLHSLETRGHYGRLIQ
jgi:hypothetical protein